MSQAYDQRVVSVAAAIYALGFGALCTIKFLTFQYGDFDLAHHAQSMHSLLNGSLYGSILGLPFFGNHMNVILVALVPLYAIFPSPLLLLWVQTGALAVTAPLLYAVCRRQLPSPWTWLWPLVYLGYPPLHYANLYEFHPVLLSVPFFIAAYLALIKHQAWRFGTLLTLAVLCQENLALVAAGFGLLAWYHRKPIPWILIPILAGAFWFGLCVFLIMPQLNPGIIQFTRLYNHLGADMTEIFVTVFFRPWQVLPTMYSVEKAAFMISLLAPLLFLPLLAPALWLPLLPVLLQRLLSQRASEFSILYHYQAEFIPFFFLAATAGSRRLLSIRPALRPRLPALILGVCSIIMLFASGSFHAMIQIVREANIHTAQTVIRREILQEIKSDDAVAATFDFLPHLVNRTHLYSIHHVYTGFHTLSDVPYRLPPVDVVLLNTMDPLTFGAKGFQHEQGWRNLQRELARQNLQETFRTNGIVVFRRRLTDTPR